MQKNILDTQDQPMLPTEPGFVIVQDVLVPVDPAENDPAEYP